MYSDGQSFVPDLITEVFSQCVTYTQIICIKLTEIHKYMYNSRNHLRHKERSSLRQAAFEAALKSSPSCHPPRHSPLLLSSGDTHRQREVTKTSAADYFIMSTSILEHSFMDKSYR